MAVDRFMTSSELTSGCDFACDSLRVTALHLCIKLGENIFIQFGYIKILRNSTRPLSAVLDLLEGVVGPPTKAHSWWIPSVKFHDRLISFEVKRI